MKMKKIWLCGALFIILISLFNNVFAAENQQPKVDFSNAKFKVVNTTNGGQFFSLEVSNITLPNKSNGKPVELNVRYTIGNKQPEFSNKYGESYLGTYDEQNKKIVFSRLETVLQLKGDVYFWIFQLDDVPLGSTQTGSLVYSNKIERPADKKYSELFGSPLIGSTITYISINTPMENYLERKAQFRIGEITDNSILSAIKNKDTANGFDKLLNYSKKSSAIYDGELRGKPSFVAGLHEDLLGKVKQNSYYFIYVKFDDENGKYYPVEGVTVGKGLAPTAQSCEIAFYGNSKFDWNNFTEIKPSPSPTPTEGTDKKEDNKNDSKKPTNNETQNKTENKGKDTTAAKGELPYTGKQNIILGFIIILSISSVMLYFLNRKYKFI